MQKKYLFMFLPLLVLVLVNTSYGWQGRMAGVGDPYGLLSDESDFLIHPAKIVNGEGVRFYGDYRFTYNDVMDWDYDLDRFTPAGVLANYFHYDGSGQEYKHNALLGAATPVGPGRFGIFFTYDGMRGDYEGDGVTSLIGLDTIYDLTKNLDNFALRLLYGLPLGGSFNAGGEVQFAYRQEENKNWLQFPSLLGGWLNSLFGLSSPERELLPFQIPYDSSYWEALFKGSLEGMVGPLDLEFTLRGGFIFGGDNNLLIERQIPVGTMEARVDMDGDVQGWQIGGDLWISYQLADDLALPFLVRVDYQNKTRDGDGPGTLDWTPWYINYENNEENLRLEVGGGVDKELGKATRIAAGIYYNYLKGEHNVKEMMWGALINEVFDSSNYPASTEHQIIFKLSGELELTPTITLRVGFEPFFGWVREDFSFTFANSAPSSYTNDISLDGYHWGIGGSLGGSVQFDSFTMEPFINVGWQQVDLAGDGENAAGGAIVALWDMDLSRSEWYIGGGFSVLFDVP